MVLALAGILHGEKSKRYRFWRQIRGAKQWRHLETYELQGQGAVSVEEEFSSQWKGSPRCVTPVLHERQYYIQMPILYSWIVGGSSCSDMEWLPAPFRITDYFPEAVKMFLFWSLQAAVTDYWSPGVLWDLCVGRPVEEINCVSERLREVATMQCVDGLIRATWA